MFILYDKLEETVRGESSEEIFYFYWKFHYIVFCRFFITAVLSGFLLTSFYTPDMGDHGRMGGRGPMNGPMSGQRGFNQMVFNIPFWSGLISATLSFWVSNKWEK